MKRKILCVCFGNTCRSPMLQALLSQILPREDFEIESAGLADRSGAPASPHAIECMRERCLDITAHRSRRASDLELSSYDRIYCVGETLAQKLVALGASREKVEVIEVSNPYGQDLEIYRACAEILSQLTKTLVSKLVQ